MAPSAAAPWAHRQVAAEEEVRVSWPQVEEEAGPPRLGKARQAARLAAQEQPAVR